MEPFYTSPHYRTLALNPQLHPVPGLYIALAVADVFDLIDVLKFWDCRPLNPKPLNSKP